MFCDAIRYSTCMPIKLTLEYGLGWLINVNCNTDCELLLTM